MAASKKLFQSFKLEGFTFIEIGDMEIWDGADLSLLRDTLLAAAALLHLAKATLASGRYDDALAYATRSWSLKRDPLCAEVACLAAAACGQAGTLARWRHCAVRQ